MPTAVDLNETLIQDSIVGSVRNVCSTMLRKEAALRERGSSPHNTTYHLMANVGFAGEATGIVYLCLSDDFAAYATGAILGMSAEEVSAGGFELTKDAIGEITNMTAGGFKNRLCDLGFPCKLTLPTIVRAQGVAVASLRGTTRYVFDFDCAGHILTADLQVKAG